MRPTAVLLALTLVSSAGCFVGGTAAERRACYVINGSIAALGAAVAYSGNHSPSGCGDRDGCWSGGNLGAELTGAIMVVSGLVGIVRNVAAADDERAKAIASPPRAAIAGLVTGPGLRPARVEVR